MRINRESGKMEPEMLRRGMLVTFLEVDFAALQCTRLGWRSTPEIQQPLAIFLLPQWFAQIKEASEPKIRMQQAH